jgi:hypothetical protein
MFIVILLGLVSDGASVAFGCISGCFDDASNHDQAHLQALITAYLENDIVNPSPDYRTQRLALRGSMLGLILVASIAYGLRARVPPLLIAWIKTLTLIGVTLLLYARIYYEPK